MRGGEGAEIIYPLRSTDTLARNILESIGEEGQLMRKYYQRRLPEDPSRDYYYIMRETPNTTALLIEYGFIDNANDRRKLEENLTDYAEAVVRAVANYTGTTYIPPGSTAQNTYTVKSGDTLYSIASRFGLTVNELKELNNLTSNNLQIGQILITSEGETEETPPTNNNTYTVVSGDTLYKIAREFNTTVGELISLNNLTNTSLAIGQVLQIPTNIEAPEEPEQDYILYTVKKGDSLWKISQEYGVAVNTIIDLNNLSSTALQIGDILKIPVTSTEEPSPPTSNYIEYTVKSGDSLWLIANRYNTTVDAIKNASGITSNTLQIGQILRIPTTTSYITYTVKSGDNLWSIARNYNTTVGEIRNLNNLTSNILNIGDTLLIPTM